MNLKCLLTRVVLKLATFIFPIYKPGKSPVRIPSEYIVFSNLPFDKIPNRIVDPLIKAYQNIFAREPWNEKWTKQEIISKLKKELSGDYFYLVLMKGDKEWPVAALHWGAIITVDDLLERITYVLGEETEVIKKTKWLEIFLKKKGVKKILFLDDVLIVENFRHGGVNRIRFLFLHGIEKSVEEGVKKVIFWTNSKSKALPFATLMGFEPILTVKVNNKKIVFLYHPDIRPLVKLSQNIGPKRIKTMMKLISNF